MTLLATGAIAVSAILLVLLFLGDPKRRRAARSAGDGHRRATRRLLATAALLPGMWCLWQGQFAAFLIWLGGCAMAGWLIVLCFSRARGGRPTPSG